eukprot:6384666-Alexandrium_andersonii.AAC.1
MQCRRVVLLRPPLEEGAGLEGHPVVLREPRLQARAQPREAAVRSSADCHRRGPGQTACGK